jgi:hypothetical protein
MDYQFLKMFMLMLHLLPISQNVYVNVTLGLSIYQNVYVNVTLGLSFSQNVYVNVTWIINLSKCLC